MQSTPSPRVVFFGMMGAFSLPPLQALLHSNIQVVAIVTPATGNREVALSRKLPVRSPRSLLPMYQGTGGTSIVQLGWERDIPVWEVQRLSDPETTEMLASYQADVFCVACFSLRIPQQILQLPRFGCVNIHPSLLPALRGPDPLFWTFYRGDKQTGVTVHLMDAGLDTGDILHQIEIEVPVGIRYAELEYQCAARGGEILVQAVHDLWMGAARRKPQRPELSSYYPLPDPDDFIIPVIEWDVERVYRFICGVASREEPLWLAMGTEEIAVTACFSYSHNEPDERVVSEYRQPGRRWIRCRDGWVGVISHPVEK